MTTQLKKVQFIINGDVVFEYVRSNENIEIADIEIKIIDDIVGV